jgi:hypothetical protein
MEAAARSAAFDPGRLPTRGLHVTETIAPESPTTPSPKGLLTRFFGVLTSPRDTYADIARKPNWLGMFLLVAVIVGGLSSWFAATDVGRVATADQAVKSTQNIGFKLSPEQLDKIREGILNASAARLYAQTFGTTLVAMPIVAAIVAGILIGIFNALMGGNASFKQVYAVVIYSQAISCLKVIFVTPLNYFRESLSNPATLAALFPMLDDSGLPSKLLGAIDFFTLWWMLSLSIGLGVLYKRPTKGIAISLISVYVVLAVVIITAISLITG